MAPAKARCVKTGAKVPPEIQELEVPPDLGRPGKRAAGRGSGRLCLPRGRKGWLRSWQLEPLGNLGLCSTALGS